MNANSQGFVDSAERFLSSGAKSRDAVADLEGTFAEAIEPAWDELPEPLSELQHAFALYSPERGDHLIDYDGLCTALRAAIRWLRANATPSAP